MPPPTTSDSPTSAISEEQPTTITVKSTVVQQQSTASVSVATLAGEGGTSCNGGQNCNDPTNNGGTQQIVQIKNGSGRLHASFSFLGVSGILAAMLLIFLRL